MSTVYKLQTNFQGTSGASAISKSFNVFFLKIVRVEKGNSYPD